MGDDNGGAMARDRAEEKTLAVWGNKCFSGATWGGVAAGRCCCGDRLLKTGPSGALFV